MWEGFCCSEPKNRSPKHQWRKHQSTRFLKATAGLTLENPLAGTVTSRSAGGVSAQPSPATSDLANPADVQGWSFAAIALLGILVIFKRCRSTHCERRITNSDGVLIDGGGDSECAHNPYGLDHEVKSLPMTKTRVAAARGVSAHT